MLLNVQEIKYDLKDKVIIDTKIMGRLGHYNHGETSINDFLVSF